MLQRSRTRVRDWLVFGLAAALPVVVAGFVAWRALGNEEAARRREAEVELEQAAAGLGPRVARKLAEAGAALERANGAHLVDEVKRLKPAFASAVVLDEDRQLVYPEPARAPAPSAACRELAERIATPLGPAEHARVEARILAACPDVRSASGRLLYPIAALDAARRDVAPAFVKWLDEHAAALASAERAATGAAVARATWLDADERRRAAAILSRQRNGSDEIARTLAAPAARRALARLGTDHRVVSWEDAGSAGVLASFEGRIAGFLVTPGSLVDASDRMALPPDVVVRSAPGVGHGPQAIAHVGPDLAVRLELADPARIDQLTASSRRSLALAGAASALMALAFVGAAFARMRAARRLGELRTDFVSAVSHELRTPIASLRMLAELLEQDRVEPGERAEVTAALSREARRLGETVDRLLGFSRMSADRVLANRRMVHVAEPLRASIAAFEERHPGVRVAQELDLALEASVDAEQLRLATDNLLENARKYAPGGEPYRVVLRRVADAAEIAVEDHGPGVAPRDRRRVFEPFERADDRLSEATEGSGIGLALVQHVARSHGGRAWVEAAPGGGARFVVRLPGAVA